MARARRDEDFDPTTPNGTPLNEAVSALIKELRRGHELEALYWAREIESKFWKYVWKRLLIFAAEDVSIANPMAIAQVEACHQAYLLTRESKTGGEMTFCPHCGAVIDGSPVEAGRADKDVLALAVLILARSPKCRESNLLWAMLIEFDKVGWRPELPEYALDGHTRRGREMFPNRDERHVRWFLDWSQVHPNVGPNDVHAWHVERMVQQGRIPADLGQEIIDKYVADDQLVYGSTEGAPWPKWREVARPASEG